MFDWFWALLGFVKYSVALKRLDSEKITAVLWVHKSNAGPIQKFFDFVERLRQSGWEQES